MRKLALLAATGLAATFMSSAAIAGPSIGPAEASIGGCAFAEAFFGAPSVACSGYYPGQVMSGTLPQGDVSTQIAALATLGITGLTPQNFNFGGYPNINLSDSSTSLNFSTAMSGLTVIGVHWGNISDPNVPANPSGSSAHDYTAFFEFNLAPGTTSIPILSIPGPNNTTLSGAHGLSGAVLYGPAAPSVPEPASWALMMVGFGAAGAALRRTRRAKALTQFA